VGLSLVCLLFLIPSALLIINNFSDSKNHFINQRTLCPRMDVQPKGKSNVRIYNEVLWCIDFSNYQKRFFSNKNKTLT
jgi:hypothetical protein